MKQTFLLAGLGVALFLGASMTLVALLTGDPPPAPPPQALALAPSPSDAAPVAPPVASPPRRAAPGGASGQARARWTSATEDPSPTPMADRVLRKVIRTALLAPPVQARLALCVDRSGGFGGSAKPSRVPRPAPAVLQLELETQPGALRVVGVQIQAWGGASTDVVSCAQGVLRAQVIAASTEPGQRLRMPFPLSPRGEALAGVR